MHITAAVGAGLALHSICTNRSLALPHFAPQYHVRVPTGSRAAPSARPNPKNGGRTSTPQVPASLATEGCSSHLSPKEDAVLPPKGRSRRRRGSTGHLGYKLVSGAVPRASAWLEIPAPRGCSSDEIATPRDCRLRRRWGSPQRGRSQPSLIAASSRTRAPRSAPTTPLVWTRHGTASRPTSSFCSHGSGSPVRSAAALIVRLEQLEALPARSRATTAACYPRGKRKRAVGCRCRSRA